MTELSKEEIDFRLEHRNALIDIRMILETQTGRRFLKYLFKNLDVGQLPELGLDGTILADRLGFLRAGRSVFEIVSEANFEKAGQLIAEIEKERHEKLLDQAQDG